VVRVCDCVDIPPSRSACVNATGDDPTESSAEIVCPFDDDKRDMNGLEVGDVNTGSLPELRTCVKSLLSGLNIGLVNG